MNESYGELMNELRRIVTVLAEEQGCIIHGMDVDWIDVGEMNGNNHPVLARINFEITQFEQEIENHGTH